MGTKPKRKLREVDVAISRAVEPFLAQLMREKHNDRAQVIIGGSFLDAILEQMLWTAMADASWKRDLFEGGGPLATFSARIDLTCALGLIPESLRRDLHLVRKLRNHFAHQVMGGRLTDNPAKQYLEATSVYAFVRGPHSKRGTPMEPRTAFRGTLAVLIGFLQSHLSHVKGRRKMKDRPLLLQVPPRQASKPKGIRKAP